MPSRRIPQSHIARRKTIRRAYNKGKNLAPGDRPFPAEVWAKINLDDATSLASRYFASLGAVDTAERNLSDSTTVVERTFPVLARCISHFFQVLDFAIEREILPPSVREYHGRDKNAAKVPVITSHDEAIERAEAIIDGEKQRATEDGSQHRPMALPALDELKRDHKAFTDVRTIQSPLKDALVLAQAAVEALMQGPEGILRLIEDLYDETEHTYRHLEDGAKRTICHEWGITYEGGPELPEEEPADPGAPPTPLMPPETPPTP